MSGESRNNCLDCLLLTEFESLALERRYSKTFTRRLLGCYVEEPRWVSSPRLKCIRTGSGILDLTRIIIRVALWWLPLLVLIRSIKGDSREVSHRPLDLIKVITSFARSSFGWHSYLRRWYSHSAPLSTNSLRLLHLPLPSQLFLL